ncbi:uncharacterized protein [Cherax quadricarinatus]
MPLRQMTTSSVDEMEDAHMCLRCKAIIVGLSNYVTHRRAGCTAATPQDTQPHTQQPQTHTAGKAFEREESRKDVVQFSGSRNTFSHDDNKFSSQDGSHEKLSHHEDNLDGAKYMSPASVSLENCYMRRPVEESQDQSLTKVEVRPAEDPPVTRAGIGPLHDSYTVMEDLTGVIPQSHADAQISNGLTSLKAKSQDSLALSHRQNPAQVPFTSYSDPLLPHGQEPSNISLFRHFDTFNNPNKVTHEGESESHSETIALFKVASTSYDLESQNFESRYSEFYNLQATPHEPLLTTVPALEQCKVKKDTRILKKVEEILENRSGKQRDLDREKGNNQEIRDAGGEFREANLKYSEPQLSPGNENIAQDKPELRQDDFLSSLELRSSVKATRKRRHDDDEEFDEDEDDDIGPPHHHTGGKWRPGSQPPPSVGGKWRPATPKNELEDEVEMEDDEAEEEEDALMSPPPTYTKGKWLPGKKITTIIKVGRSVEHQCDVCNWTLKSKETCERHVNCEHQVINNNKASGKKVIKTSKEIPSAAVTSRPVRSKKLEAKGFLKSTIAQLKSRKIISLDESKNNKALNRTCGSIRKNANAPLADKTLLNVKQEMKQEVNEDEEEEVKKVSLVTPKLLCPICKLSFGEAYAALHFASLAHIHNELEYKQNRCDEIDANFNQIILSNFGAILKTSPFFCSGCKFYCNLQDDFLAHMKTHVDDLEDDEVKTFYSCSVCTDEDEMRLLGVLRHLHTPHHLDNARDTVLQARQVIISSRTAVVCPLGDGTFRTMREYRTHRRVHHQEPGFQLSHQRLLRCPQCSFKALREREIRTHIREEHEDKNSKRNSYHCFVCGLAFATHRQAELHRRSAEHRTTLGRQRGLSVVRTCSLCYLELEDLPALRRHMCQEHQKHCTPCHLCGVVPPLRSDLAQHQRVCCGLPADLTGDHKCDLCTFKNDLLAHVLAHKTLAHGQRGADGRHACHICKTKLRFSSVKGHMLSHSNEWPHACHLCSRKFPQQEWLERHLCVVHTRGGGDSHTTHGPALCDTCGKTLSNRWHLYRHQMEVHTHAHLSPPAHKVHTHLSPPTHKAQTHLSPPAHKDSQGDSLQEAESSSSSSQRNRRSRRLPNATSPVLCDVCGVQCESASVLKVHRGSHKRSAGDQYDCPHCNYSTTHLPHLRRHLRLHTGSTPFSCPYCAYVCNNQENLRKHMLKTKRHPGRFMYECRLCVVSQEPPAGYHEVSKTVCVISEDTPAGHHHVSTSQNLNLESSQPLNLASSLQTLSHVSSNSQCLSLDVSTSQSLNIDTTTSQTFCLGSSASQSLNIGSSNSPSLNLSSAISQTLNLCSSTSQDLNISSSTSQCLNSESSSSHPLESGNSKTVNLCVPKCLSIDEPQPMSQEVPMCFNAKVPSTLDSKIPRELEHDVFKSNYAKEFQAHLLEKHRGAFETKEDVTSHIRSYYRAEDDATVTSTPLPFVHKQRYRRASCGRDPKSEHPDEPGSEDTEEGDEDVLSQIKDSLDIGMYVSGNKDERGPEGREAAEEKTVEEEDEKDRDEEGSVERCGDLQGGEGKDATCGSVRLDAGVAVVADRQIHPVASSRSSRSYLRPVSRPSILRPTHAHGGTHHPLRIMIQHLPEGGSDEGEDDGTRQVILILPDKVGEQPGEVAALLPSLGLTATPADCVSIATVQPKHFQRHLQQHSSQQLQAASRVLSQEEHMVARTSHGRPQDTKNPVEAAVIVQSDQVITLDTQVVADALGSGESRVSSQHQNAVVLCSQTNQLQQQQVLHATHVFNPLQVVAEAAEVLTQGEDIVRQTHNVLTQQVLAHTSEAREILTQNPPQEILHQPQITQESLSQTPVAQVLTHPPVAQEILTQASDTQESQILEATIFESAGGVQQAGTSRAQDPPIILQDASLQFMGERVIPPGGQLKRHGDEEGAGEIIYSFTLQ